MSPPKSGFILQEVASIDLPFADWTHGMSGLAFEKGRDRLTIFSDRGRISQVDLRFGANGALGGANPHTSIRAASEKGKWVMDFEAGVRLADGGWLMSVERPNRLIFYAGTGMAAFEEAPQAWSIPDSLVGQPVNKGAEAMTLLADGRLLLIGESATDGLHPLWIGDNRGWQRIGYDTSPGFSPVEAAPHPCGGLLVLERAANILRGLTGRLVVISQSALESAKDGDVLAPQEIGPVEPSTGRGNFEGMAIIPTSERHCPRSIEVIVASDDNKIRLLPRTLTQYRLLPSGGAG